MPKTSPVSLSRRTTAVQALALVDVKVLDHFVIGDGVSMSFAERGML